MFNIQALIKMINSNNDQCIQKEEVQDFLKKQQKPSVFNNYFESINEEINLMNFENQVYQIAENEHIKTGKAPTIEFKEEFIQEYQKCTLEIINEIHW